MIRIIISILIVFTFFSCQKAEDRRCMKSYGEVVTIEKSLDPFNKIKLGPHIKFTLVQDTEDKLVITGGKNVVNFVSSDFEDGTLVIENKNTCNFLRSLKKKIEVEVHFKDIEHLTYEGTEELTSKETIDLDYILFLLRDGAGTVKLDLNTINTTVVTTNGWSNFDLSGHTKFLKLEMRGNGFGTTRNLAVQDSINVISSTSEVVKLNSNAIPLRVELDGYGDVWYYGTPSVINVTQYGEGKLIDKN